MFATDDEQAAKQAQVELLVNELERANSAIATLERERVSSPISFCSPPSFLLLSLFGIVSLLQLLTKFDRTS